MKIIAILASGTGGHVYPAYTIAQEYISRGYKILWIGTENGLENRVINNPSIIIEHVSSQGIRGKSPLKKILGLFNFLRSIYESFRLLKKYKPSLTIGFGGYVSVGASITSFLLSIPLVVHEQNSIAGTANKINYYFAKRVYETFPLSFKKNNKKILHTGNPVRPSFDKVKKPEEKYINNNPCINILVMGGSQGAEFLNNTMPFSFSHFHNTNISIKHISGLNHAESVKNKYLKYSIDAKVIEYSEKIDNLYDWADLVICRAGSTSISELAKIGIAALLVPFPYATDNHQFFNASYLAKNSAAILLEEKINFIENFVTITNILLNDQKRMYMLSKNIQNIFPLNAISIIMKDSLKLIK